MMNLKMSGGGSDSSDDNAETNPFDSTPVDADITECPNPKDCTAPALLEAWLSRSQDSTQSDPDIVECPNPKDCTAPGALDTGTT
jgi:hypothetical protein